MPSDIDNLLYLCSKNRELPKILELLPWLTAPSKNNRLIVNIKLAEFFQSIGDIEKAEAFSIRAWALSGFRPDLKPDNLSEFGGATDEILRTREQYKRLGLDAALQGDITKALSFFNAWQYAYNHKYGADVYEYDPEVLSALDTLAQAYKLKQPITGTANKKIRIGYLLFGVTHKSSVIVKIAEYLGKCSNKQDFEVFFYLTDRATDIYKRPHAISNINKIKKTGCRIKYAQLFGGRKKQLIGVAKEIQSDRIDILVTTAGLADFSHYLVTKICSVSVRIGLVQGPPPQYIAPDFDCGISWTNHPLIDCPTDCQKVNLEVELPRKIEIKKIRKSALSLPDDSLMLISAGRYSKFLDITFWQAILDALASHENAYYIALGVAQHQIPFLERLAANKHFHKIRFLSWKGDYHPILNIADIMIDTYPSGGGVTVLDAMALGLPVVSFKQNYWSLFNQANWSPAEEMIPVPELILERGDFSALKVILDRLIADGQYRRAVGRYCEEHVHKFRNDPSRMVRQCEEIYARTLAQKVGNGPAR